MNWHHYINNANVTAFTAGFGVHFIWDIFGYAAAAALGVKIGHKCGSKHQHHKVTK